MKKWFCLVAMALSLSFAGCTSEGDALLDGPTLKQQELKLLKEHGWHDDGAFIGIFSVQWFDGNSFVGTGTMNTDGWMTFDFIPTENIMGKLMPENSVVKVDDGQYWNHDALGYLEQGSSEGHKISFVVRDPYPFPEGRHSIISGTYNGSDVLFLLVYEDSEASYDADRDCWEGTLKVKAVQILTKTGETLEVKTSTPSLALRFQSQKRVE